jgi:RNA polymerase sigma factor for flagellar operon FliA
MDAERLLLDNLALIERICAITARRHHLREEDAEELLSAVRCKLIDKDYEVLRTFAGKSSLSTYLTAIVQHVHLDQRNRAWGRWRPSAEAQRLGPLAIRLETLTSRDGLSLEEACAGAAEEERETMQLLASKLPTRPRRRIEGEDVLAHVASPEPTPEQALLEDERERARADLERAMAGAIERLAAEDRLLVQLRLKDGLTLVEIARVLGREAKPLYRHYEKVLAELRRSLEDGGHDAHQLSWVLERSSPRIVASTVPRRVTSSEAPP